MSTLTICWLRRDLRLHDQAALYQALKSGMPVLPVFIFDRNILDELKDPADARVTFLHDQITALQGQLQALGSGLRVYYGTPADIWPQILQELPVGAVYTNRDYEPYALQRDQALSDLLRRHNIPLHIYKDHVIFEKEEVLKDDGHPYTVFTPYSRKWRAKLISKGEAVADSFYFKSYPNEAYFQHFWQQPQPAPITLEAMGFRRSATAIPPITVPRKIIKHYDETRNFPADEDGTSRLGIHFRFGTISIREKARAASQLNDTYLNELIWRDFYAQILAHFPQVATQSFRPEYDKIAWRNDESEFKRWCEGTTGYPMVDAGMRQLNATGYMHNRVRMITASFLTKHLLIDWRWGEAYFAEKLLDFDLASNNGGWQWAAGSGTDAAPYFRIFNPASQQEKFDPEAIYIRRWIPEYDTPSYPKPIVEHKSARERCLQVYKEALR